MSMVNWELEIPNQDHNLSVLRGYLISYWLVMLISFFLYFFLLLN